MIDFNRMLEQIFAAMLGITPADTSRLSAAITALGELLPETERMKMTAPSPTGMVQIAQADLDNFAASQSTPLAAADEAGLNQALSDLQDLEPPAPAPAPPSA
jgi:hypothetical protein